MHQHLELMLSMEKLSLSSTPSPTIPRCFLSPGLPITRPRRKVSFNQVTNPKKFSVCASKDEFDTSKFDQWDLMELKFGQMLGEDAKLTLAKIMGRKMNPDASYVEIEKNFYKNKGKLVEVKEVPFDVPEKRGSGKASNGLNLVKPVPKKGSKGGGVENNSKLPEIKRPNESTRNKIGSVTNLDNSELPEIKRPDESVRSGAGSVSKSNVPNVILRKPSSFNEKDDEAYDSSRLRIKPNLSLSMRTEPVMEKFGGMTLLKKPESVNEDHGGETENSLMNGSVYSETDNIEGDLSNGGQSSFSGSDGLKLSEKPKAIMDQNADSNGSTFRSNGMDEMPGNHIEDSPESISVLMSNQDQLEDDSKTGAKHHEPTDAGYSGKEIGTSRSTIAGASGSGLPVESVLQGRPSRLDQSVKEMSRQIQEETVSAYPSGLDDQGDQDKLPLSRPLKEIEENDWTRLEQRFNFGDRVDVELISCSPRGFVASFGSLIGFLPYRNLAAKWKFLAFESWLRKNGLDPSKYRQNLGIIGNDGVSSNNSSSETSLLPELSPKVELEVTPDMELEDLLRIYDQEKIQYLSSYIGEHIKVNILLADRKSRKLIFSMRPKEKEESIERKRSLMAKLSIGDVVKCCIKKITYFGIFVEVEGVPALIHQTEVSWDATLDLSSYLKIGQIVEAKVHQLDFALERIFLSLKEISPDPLNEALECIVGNNSFDGGLQAAQEDLEWAEVDSLIKELQEVEGVQTVTKGRFFLSPGLAPTFQVYMASMFENQYKLLARSGNKVQEVMVQTLLDKEDMKSAILKCTNRVQL